MSVVWTGVTGALLRHRRKTLRSISYRDFLSSLELSRQLDPVKPISQVVHAAGLVGFAACERDREAAWGANVAGTLSLLAAAAEAGAKRFLFISTSHVYDKSMVPLREDAPTRAGSYYALTKLEAEERAAAAATELGIDFTVVRMFSLLGASGTPDSLSALVLRVLHGSREMIRFASDVRDFQTPQQYALLLDRLVEVPSLPPVVNLGSGFGLSVGDAATAQASASGRQINPAQFDWVSSDNPVAVSDPTLLRTVTRTDTQRLDFLQV